MHSCTSMLQTLMWLLGEQLTHGIEAQCCVTLVMSEASLVSISTNSCSRWLSTSRSRFS